MPAEAILRPEVHGALSLAAKHRELVEHNQVRGQRGQRRWRQKQIRRKHESKAQKLERRAEILGRREAVADVR